MKQGSDWGFPALISLSIEQNAVLEVFRFNKYLFSWATDLNRGHCSLLQEKCYCLPSSAGGKTQRKGGHPLLLELEPQGQLSIAVTKRLK